MEFQEIKGERVPSLGLGTYRLPGEDCVRAVRLALELGYRHIDTARMYRNEAEVGRGVKESGVSRDEIFLVTKIWPDDFAHDRAIAAGRDSVAKLSVDAVDLILLHWPGGDVPLSETLGAMNALKEEGLARHVGVSNFSPAQVEEAAEHTEVFCNQVKYNFREDRGELLRQARETDYLLTAYTPLARGGADAEETLEEIASSHGKSPTQVALRWLVQQEKVAAIPKATGEAHLRENLEIFDFTLSDDELERVSSLSR